MMMNQGVMRMSEYNPAVSRLINGVALWAGYYRSN